MHFRMFVVKQSGFAMPVATGINGHGDVRGRELLQKMEL